MSERRKLRLDDLKISSFFAEEKPSSQGTVFGYLTLDTCQATECDPTSCDPTMITGGCGSGGYSCADPSCACDSDGTTSPCSQDPGGATCDATCAQEDTCAYTGPDPACC